MEMVPAIEETVDRSVNNRKCCTKNNTNTLQSNKQHRLFFSLSD